MAKQASKLRVYIILLIFALFLFIAVGLFFFFITPSGAVSPPMAYIVLFLLYKLPVGFRKRPEKNLPNKQISANHCPR